MAIGSRVSCVPNLGTQIGEKTKLHGSISYQIIQTILHLRYLLGIYNGAKGTVVGFAFRGCTPTITTPLHATFHTMEPREIPTVFVKMDNPIGYTIQEGPQDIIPFVAVCRQEDKYITNITDGSYHWNQHSRAQPKKCNELQLNMVRL